ncbi:hypothetical protein A6E01_20470 (plasmid) [Vibrio breoganii]|uniref:Uncharacterized protein n=1 Tax=Vibrio breoganii TaxID=553239 RepID=A0AAN0XZP3_9VIBR|nr:hypothetical protein [Vibrio breoganii]ANO35590.1 hypothetical protein A6E01_20470 [Vibrio breoganii]
MKINLKDEKNRTVSTISFLEIELSLTSILAVWVLSIVALVPVLTISLSFVLVIYEALYGRIT